MKIRQLVVILIILFTASCSTYYHRGKSVGRSDKKLKRMGSEKLYKEVVANYLDYKNVNFKKIKITYEEEGKKQEFRGSVRVLKDSVIWLSISKMGIEGVRVLLTPNRVSFIDRLHRGYLNTDYSYLNRKFHLELDFYLIQSILMNQLPEYRMNQLPEYRIVNDKPFYKNFKSRRSKDKKKKHYLFINRNRKDKKYWKAYAKATGNKGFTSETFSITPDLMRLEGVSIFEPQFFRDGSRQLLTFKLGYQDYRKYEEKYLFPQKIIVKLSRKLFDKEAQLEEVDFFGILELEMPTPKEENKAKLTIEIDKLKVNEEGLRFPFKISSKYKRINE